MSQDKLSISYFGFPYFFFDDDDVLEMIFLPIFLTLSLTRAVGLPIETTEHRVWRNHIMMKSTVFIVKEIRKGVHNTFFFFLSTGRVINFFFFPT
jgi:hypothetical protein